MKIYFLSSQPCALTLNGIFYGVTDLFERSVELSLADKIYAKFSPEGRLPVGFFITEEITTTPPDGCEVYLLQDAVAIYARDFPPVDFTLRLIAQKREGDLFATVYSQGNIQLSVESAEGFFNATIPPCFSSCELFLHGNFLLLKGERHLGVFTKKAERIFVEKVLSYSVEEDRLSAVLPLCDSQKRQAKCEWDLRAPACPMTSFALLQSVENGANTDDLPEEIIAYAFFESVLLRADFEVFLAEELRAEKEKIVAFLGDFFAVTLTKEKNVCGLLRKKGERLFVVDDYSILLKDGKIIDVRG